MSLMDRAHRVFISNNAKLWTNIVFGVATYKILTTPMKEISEAAWIGWLSTAGGIELTKRWIYGKTGVTTEEPDPDADDPPPPDCPPPPKPHIIARTR